MARVGGRRRLPVRDNASTRSRWSEPRKALLAVAIVASAFADDRRVGRIGDARQVIETAVGMVTTGELGVARGIGDETIPRPGGDASARYGLGMSVAQVPAAALAPSFESAFGPGGSQSLFLLAPILFGLLAAGAAGRAARLLGAGERGQAIAVLLASLGSPLGGYFTSDLSEPLQAACLAGAFVAALESRRQETRRRSLVWAVAGGLCAGAAVLTKSNLVAVAPFALLPLVGSLRNPFGASRAARVAAAAAGSAPLLGLWVATEFARFGGLVKNYGGYGFSYPFVEGAFRLLVLPNKGLFLFFPALAIALVEVVRRLRAGVQPDGTIPETGGIRLEALAGLLPLAALLAMAAPWWAWHGIGGWGPRLLVPGLPAVAALAACALERMSPSRQRVFVAASIALNALPLLESPAPVSAYITRLGPVRVAPEVTRRFPRYVDPAAPGTTDLVPGVFVLAEVPLAADHVVYAWFLWARSGGDAPERARRLGLPPWRSARPDLAMIPGVLTPHFAASVAPPLGFGFLGRSITVRSDPWGGRAYARALANQVFRAQQQRRLDRALDLSTRLLGISPLPEPVALVAESYRLLGRHETLRSFLDSLPPEVRGTPPVFAVLALAARDVGEIEAARAYMGRAEDIGTPAVRRALVREPAEWPPDFASLMADERLSVEADLPGLGEKAQ